MEQKCDENGKWEAIATFEKLQRHGWMVLHTKRWINSPYFWSGVVRLEWKLFRCLDGPLFLVQKKKTRAATSAACLCQKPENTQKKSKCTTTTVIVIYSTTVKSDENWPVITPFYFHSALLWCCFKMKPELILLFFSSYGPYLTTMNKSVHNQCVRTFPPCVEFINLCLYLKMRIRRSTSQTICMHRV